MALQCNSRGCDREVAEFRHLSRNKVFENYCSLYCFEATERGIETHKNDCTGNVPSQTRPSIQNQCYVCRTLYNLRYEAFTANQRFCSRGCYDEISSYKNGHRDFLLLCILYERGEMTAKEVARISSSMSKNLSSLGVSRVMGAWAGRGVVTICRGKPHYFTYNPLLLPGESITRYCRKR